MSEQGDSRCLTCGTEVGQIAFGRFIKHVGCGAALPRKGGLPRCCRCGGTLDLALMEGHVSLADDRIIGEGASPRLSGRRKGRRDGGRGSGAAYRAARRARPTLRAHLVPGPFPDLPLLGRGSSSWCLPLP